MNISELDFSRTIVYEEDDIHSPSLNSIKQDEDVDMSFDVLITVKTYIKKNKMYKKTNKNLENMHENITNKNNDFLEEYDKLI